METRFGTSDDDYDVSRLAQHNLAFRGSSDKLFTKNNGNFLGLVELFGMFDDVMREHLRKVVKKETSDHYCGKTIQGEIITVLANKYCKGLKKPDIILSFSIALQTLTILSKCISQ